MPEKIIRKFQREYGSANGKAIYYATANAQGRDPETFKKLGPRKLMPTVRKMKTRRAKP